MIATLTRDTGQTQIFDLIVPSVTVTVVNLMTERDFAIDKYPS